MRNGPRRQNSAAWITSHIKKLSTIAEVLEVHCTHGSDFNELHLPASWMSLSGLAKRKLAERRWLKSNERKLQLLIQHTLNAALAGEIGPRALANVAYGAARACKGELRGGLFSALARAAERRVADFKAQGLANTAWTQRQGTTANWRL